MALTPRTSAQKRVDRRRITAVAVLVLLAVVIAMYLWDVGWVVLSLDALWQLFDVSIERLKVLAALLPLAVAYIAYRVYRADRWWKRAEWALSASLNRDESMSSMGNRFIALLADSGMAPKDDLDIWNKLGTEKRDDLLVEILERDLEAQEEEPSAAFAFRQYESVIYAPSGQIGPPQLLGLIREFLTWEQISGTAELRTDQVTQLLTDAERWSERNVVYGPPGDAPPSERA